MTSVGLVVSVIGFGVLLTSSADAQQRNRVPRAYGDQPSYYGRGVTVMPRNTPPSYVVCWTPCGQPGAIVLGAILIHSFVSRFCAMQVDTLVAAVANVQITAIFCAKNPARACVW